MSKTLSDTVRFCCVAFLILNVGLKKHTIAHSVKLNRFSITIQLLLSTHMVLADILLGVCTAADLVV